MVKLISMQNKLKETKMLLGLSTLAGVSFGGLSSWLLYPQISAETTVQSANLMAVGAGGAVAIMFMAVPTIVYTIERKNFKEFKKDEEVLSKLKLTDKQVLKDACDGLWVDSIEKLDPEDESEAPTYEFCKQLYYFLKEML